MPAHPSGPTEFQLSTTWLWMPSPGFCLFSGFTWKEQFHKHDRNPSCWLPRGLYERASIGNGARHRSISILSPTASSSASIRVSEDLNGHSSKLLKREAHHVAHLRPASTSSSSS